MTSLCNKSPYTEPRYEVNRIPARVSLRNDIQRFRIRSPSRQSDVISNATKDYYNRHVYHRDTRAYGLRKNIVYVHTLQSRPDDAHGETRKFQVAKPFISHAEGSAADEKRLGTRKIRHGESHVAAVIVTVVVRDDTMEINLTKTVWAHSHIATASHRYRSSFSLSLRFQSA